MNDEENARRIAKLAIETTKQSGDDDALDQIQDCVRNDHYSIDATGFLIAELYEDDAGKRLLSTVAQQWATLR